MEVSDQLHSQPALPSMPNGEPQRRSERCGTLIPRQSSPYPSHNSLPTELSMHNIKMDLKILGCFGGPKLFGSGYRVVAVSCEHSNEPSGPASGLLTSQEILCFMHLVC
jgi:hypothetical protein